MPKARQIKNTSPAPIITNKIVGTHVGTSGFVVSFPNVAMPVNISGARFTAKTITIKAPTR